MPLGKGNHKESNTREDKKNKTKPQHRHSEVYFPIDSLLYGFGAQYLAQLQGKEKERSVIVHRGDIVSILARKFRGIVGCRSEEHTSELQSQSNLVCRLLLEKKKNLCYRSSLS